MPAIPVRFSVKSRGPCLEFQRAALTPLFDRWRVGVGAGRSLRLCAYRDRVEMRPSDYGPHLCEQTAAKLWALVVTDEGQSYVVRSGVIELEAEFDDARLVALLPPPLELPWPRLHALSIDAKRELAIQEIEARLNYARGAVGSDSRDVKIPESYLAALRPTDRQRIGR